MMVSFQTLLVTVALLSGPVQGHKQQSKSPVLPAKAAAWERYTNVRFGFSVLYPKDLLIAQGESGNSDGQSFKAASGAELLVYGRNAMGQKLASVAAASGREHAGPGGQVTYKRIKSNWFVVSGKSKGSYFYCKGFMRDGTFKLMELSYPVQDTATYKVVIPKLLAGFHNLPN